METQKVMTTKEVADLLGFSKSHVERLISEKRIPHHKPLGRGGKTFFNYEEIMAWLFSEKEKEAKHG